MDVLWVPALPTFGPEVTLKLTVTPETGVEFVVTVAVTVWAVLTMLVANAGASEQSAIGPEPAGTTRQAENSEVLLPGSVAVAVTNSPAATVTGKVKAKALEQLAP